MMMMSSDFARHTAVILATAFWACSASAQMPLSLQEAQDQGAEHAYAMQRAELDVEMAQTGHQGTLGHRFATGECGH